MLRQIAEIIPFYALLVFLKLFSFEKKVIMGGLLLRWILPIVPKYRKRVIKNLRLIYPEKTHLQINEFISINSEMIGRSFIELMFNQEFQKRWYKIIYKKEELQPIIDAKKRAKPIIVVSGHIGSWEAVRAVLKNNNLNSGALYQKNHNRFYEKLHLDAIKAGGKPIFQVSPSGTRNMISFIKKGGLIALMVDQAVKDGKYVNFLGKPAKTSMSIANIALKYDAIIIPAYGIRREDNKIVVSFEKPIKLTKSLAITSAINSSLEARVQANPEQWYWPHRRWK
ncbi:hypothetical protein CBE37_01595 [bacterium TMED277]|nr:MAG: hypothetical protein CBE37_01595 [bacterium TMED277]PQM63587.1 MAG: acyltransferase [Paracoccaceae bacterium]